MREQLNPTLPERTPPTRDAFDTRPKAVKQWVESLPLANMGEASRQIYQALMSTNHLDIPPRQRFDFLERITPPLQTVRSGLSAHFAEAGFPLPEKARRVAELSTELLLHAADGYRIILEEGGRLPWYQRRHWLSMAATATHRCLRYYSDVLCNFRLLHLSDPRGIWLQIHRLYRAADRGHLLEKSVPTVDGSPVESTIEFEYKRLLLLALLSPRHFRTRQMREIREHMPEWTALVRLLRAEREPCPTPYRIDLESDHPPLFRRNPEAAQSGESVRCLDTKLLLDRLRNASSDPYGPDPETAEGLLTCWDQPPERATERRLSQGDVNIALGIGAVHALLEAEHRAPPPEPQEKAEPEAPDFNLEPQTVQHMAQLHSRELVASKEEAPDVWDSIYVRPVGQEKNWTESRAQRDYHTIPARLLDYSDGGFRIELDGSELEGRTRVGELIGLWDKEHTTCKVGHVRWLRQIGEGRLTIGIKRLASRVQPAAVHIHTDGERSEPIPCLLGLDQATPTAILPYLPGLGKKQLSLAYHDYESDIELGEQLENSPTFSAHHFQELNATPGRRSAVTEYLPQETQQLVLPEDPASDDGRFNGLWDEL